MELIAPTDFGSGLLRALRRHPVRVLYGSLPDEPSMRPGHWLPAVGEAEAAAHIRSARDAGIGFTWALNASCLGNLEFTGAGQQWLMRRLGWLEDVGAEGVTTANPYVVQLVKERFPALRVTVSVVAEVDTLEKARFYEDMGADTIYVPPDCNRDFRFLRELRRAVRCDLAVLVNEGCLLHCPMRAYHGNFTSHAAESLGGGFYVDYCILRCTAMKRAEPAALLRSPWVRPEDLAVYEELGYHRFKLAGRDKPAAWILRAVRAYAARRHGGDLGELIGGFEGLAPRLRVRNDRLDGFLASFRSRDCRRGCGACRNCPDWAERAVEVRAMPEDPEPGRMLQSLVDGTVRFGSARGGGGRSPGCGTREAG